MEELNQFLNSVEASARKILKQQNKKQQQLIARERVANARSSSTSHTATSSPKISKEELRVTYGSGGALIVHAPTSPHQQNQLSSSPVGRRSEHVSDVADDDERRSLPRIHPPLSPTPNQSLHSSTSMSNLASSQHNNASLPAIVDKKQEKSKGQRNKHASMKLLNSPLYKSLAKSKSDQGFSTASTTSPAQVLKKTLQDVDNVSLLLKKMGLRNGGNSPTLRPDHAVEKRMCHACWAQPNRMTGCEHHLRVLPAHQYNDDSGAMLRVTELQGPTSWLTDDLYVKYRSEKDREALWEVFLRLKEEEKREKEEHSNQKKEHLTELCVIPIITRHPVYAKYYTQIELENIRTQAETRKRNQTKAFIFDVNHIWLINLDHFNEQSYKTRKRKSTSRLTIPELETSDEDDLDQAEQNSLRDRRDEAAIQHGYSQIQSISTSRALQNAVFPDMNSVVASYSFQRQPSINNNSVLKQAVTSTQRQRRRQSPKNGFYPLSLLVCGRWRADVEPNALDIVPGVALTGRRRVLWWIYQHDPPEQEYTKAVAMYTRDHTLSSSNAILVLLVVALDAPVLSPLCFAWQIGSKTSPPPIPTLNPAISDIATVVQFSPCKRSLVNTRLQSRLDSLLPCTIMVLNNIAQPDDHIMCLEEPYGHRRLWKETNEDSFRQWWIVEQSVQPNYDVIPQQCSVQVAQPNSTGVCGRFCWHSTDVIDQLLCRRRAERDFIQIIQNRRPCGSNDPAYFTVSMAHEVMMDVRAARLSAYLEMLEERRKNKEYEEKLMEIEQKLEVGRLKLEAKRQEQKRIEQEISHTEMMKQKHGSDRSTIETLGEWKHRLQHSIVLDEKHGWQMREITEDSSHVIFYYLLNEECPPAYRYTWERPVVWKNEVNADNNLDREEPKDDGNLTSRSDISSLSSSSTSSSMVSDSSLDQKQKENAEQIAQLARCLVQDEQFLQVLKEKLGLHAFAMAKAEEKSTSQKQKVSLNDSQDKDDEDEALRLDWEDQMAMLVEESDRSKASLMTTKMAKLHLNPPHRAFTRPKVPGEGWKRLKPTRLPKNFARTVYSSHTEGPRSQFINQTNHPTPVGMLDPADASPNEPPDFIPELKTHFIPKPNADLQEKKAVWATYEATQSKIPIQGNPISATAAQIRKDQLFERDPAEAEITMEERVQKAILCARNNNIEGLEAALDDGVDVNSRDNYGNTLFILVCQQGNKRLAKFLLRRHANMNLQNMNGNTGLHYLYEYKHVELAEYLKAKGAIDTITNASGLTCYEGLSQDNLEAL